MSIPLAAGDLGTTATVPRNTCTPTDFEKSGTMKRIRAPGDASTRNAPLVELSSSWNGVPETCWRMPGDGTGEEVRITLGRETRLRTVGLINGYAKTAEGVDWYHGNRRIKKVEWVFDDGTTVPQKLDDTTAVQSVDVDATTRTITLRLVEVSKPGKGPSGRNFTAISDLSLIAAH